MPAHKYEIRGDLNCEIKDRGARAVLIYQASETRQSLTADDLGRFIVSCGVKEGWSAVGLDKALHALARTRESRVEMEIAKGSAPEAPRAEKALWNELRIPEDLRADAQTALEEAGAPLITVERTEKIRREKIVKTKPPLPFLPQREQKIMEVETKTKRERVYVDATVAGHGWIEAGGRIALIEPARPGQPGRSVGGEIIPAEVLADSAVYAGNGVIKKAGELKARTSGFVRWGRNWVELLPHRPHRWEVNVTPDNATGILSFQPGSASAHPVSSARILEAAHKLGFRTDDLLTGEEIDDLIAHCLKTGEPLERVSLTPSQDAFYEIRISEDNLRAYLTIRKGRGAGKPLVLKEIGSAIRASRLRGLDLDKIRQDILSFYQGRDTVLTDYLLCEGKDPAAGPERSANCTVQFLSAKQLAAMIEEAQQRPEGLAGLESLAEFPISSVQEAGLVEQDQRVYELNHPVPGQPGCDVYGASIPGPPGPEPKFRLHENLVQKQNLIIATCRGLFEQRRTEAGIDLRVRAHSDAEARVSLAANKMEAIVSLRAAEGTGRPLDQNLIRDALRKAGVVQGIIEEAIEAACATTGDQVREIVAARGRVATEGGRTRIRFLISVASGSAMRLRSDGSADYRSRDNVTILEQGTRIAEIVPPQTAPQPGWDVCGRTLQPRQNSGPDLVIGENIEQVKEGDSIILVSKIKGELIYDKKRIDVQNIHVIRGNVDMGTGNLKFPGSVVISGSVLNGFYILAGGDIKVGEGVEAALLSADGSIFVKQGVKGAGRAVLRAKKEVVVTFLEQSMVLAVGDVKVRTSCLRSTLKTNGRLDFLTEKGTIVGGTAKARKGLSVSTLGSAAGIKTEIHFGQDYLIADQIEIEEREIKKLTETNIRLDNEMRECEKTGDRDRLAILRGEKLKNLKHIEKRSLRLFNLREKFEEHYPAEITIRGTLHPGVVIESHGRYHQVTIPKKAVTIVFNRDTGRIEERPLSRKSDEPKIDAS